VLASAELSDEDESKRPTVQIGDPFEESKLVECCLELLEQDLLASLQDLGAAGLSSSSSEMASKGEVGLDIDVSRVPLREADMEPFEIMISESQERMLCVVEPARLEEVLRLCERWDVRASVIGEVTDSEQLRVFDGDEVVGEMPVDALVDEVPLYDLEPEEPHEPVYSQPPARLPDGGPPAESLLALLGSANIASKRFVFEQYDPIVGSRTIRRPQSADAAVLVLDADGGSGAIAVSIDGNGRRVACDPYTGAAEAVLECARNLAAVGAEPLGLTNCLNFGNPEKPHIAWQLTRAVEGLRDACLALGVPVVGGNVSLYNEGAEGPIYPTPIVGMVGKLPDPQTVPRTGFVEQGHAIALVGMFEPALEGSELEKLRGRLGRRLPPLDLAAHADALVRVRAAVRSGVFPTAHDISEGGLACALAECCIEGGIGGRISLGAAFPHASADLLESALFGEAPGGVIVAGPREAVEALDGAVILGEVGGGSLEIEGALSVPVDELRATYEGAIPAAFAA
jgi:phosphoribosylformylglycinamidine synthase